MDSKDNELHMLKKGIEDLKRELDDLDSSIRSAAQAISNKLAECNKTFEMINTMNKSNELVKTANDNKPVLEAEWYEDGEHYVKLW